jgi:hypothetical protein
MVAMRSLAFVVVAILAACSGDQPPDQQNACTGAAFDLCNTEHDCTSANCHLFMSDGFQVCTQACDATTPCPNDATGAPAECNAMSICKPAMANDCHL